MTPILPSSKKRRPYRAPLGIPKGREDWRVGTGISIVMHVVIIVLLLMPLALTGDVREFAQGAGGAGPAGGGGGGTRGAGALKAELLQFIRIAPPPPTPALQPKVVPPPPPQLLPTPQPQIDTRLPVPTMTTGTSGGTGSDNTAGSGPGSGGGVGTGIGTGRGSGMGPGTGGGNQPNFPPTPIEMFIPPLPVPESVKGFHLIAEFDVDETGRVLSLKFNETRDRGYNRRLSDVLRGYRFRAGTKPDGTPIRSKAQVVVDLY